MTFLDKSILMKNVKLGVKQLIFVNANHLIFFFLLHNILNCL